MKTVAIIGRANVGKSTLFNAMVSRRFSVVEDIPGVTRDRVYGVVKRGGEPFNLIDTGGITDESEGVLDDRVKEQVDLAVIDADLLLVVLDCIHGVHPLDHEVVNLARRSKKPVLYVVNKSERGDSEVASAEFFALGIGEIHRISSAHRQGLKLLTLAIRGALGIKNEEQLLIEAVKREADEDEPEDLSVDLEDLAEVGDEAPEDSSDKRVIAAFIGRPNVGKSSLVNRILGQERVIVSPVSGTTRDSVHVDLVRNGRAFTIIDTAGLRKKARVEDGSIERYSTLRTVRSVAQADVCVVVLDATEGAPPEQEAKIAKLVHDRGKGLILVVNKWDAVKKDHRTVHSYTEAIYKIMPFARYAPLLFVSALLGRRCPSILATVDEVASNRRVRLPTSQVNKIFERAFLERPPPVYRGTPIKLMFATQVDVGPPTFVLFVNAVSRLRPSYERYLEGAVRKHTPFVGSSIKVVVRQRSSKEGRAGGRGSAKSNDGAAA